MFEKEKERERNRQRDRERVRHRQTDRQTDRQKERTRTQKPQYSRIVVLGPFGPERYYKHKHTYIIRHKQIL